MATLVPADSIVERLRNYHGPAGAYDEYRDPTGQIRPHWERMLQAFRQSGPLNLTDRWHAANRMLRENGVNFTGFEHNGRQPRPWKLDLLPVVFSSVDWNGLRQGVAQRARLVEAVIRDLYGVQRVLREGLLPPELVFRNQEFQRVFHHFPQHTTPLVIYGCELARSSTGQWWVMADRAAAPAGLSFAVENRIVLSKSLPHFLHTCQIHRLAPFFVRLQETLTAFPTQRKGNPSVVILSAGPDHPYYYEDVFLARYLGYTLVEADDLTIRRNQVWIKTLRGLSPVDVVLRRTPDHRLDPLELGGHSPNGVAGMLQAIRHKHVVVANGPETGLLDSPVYMPFLPALCKHMLGEELLLPSIATWWCGQAEPLEYVLRHFGDLVIKPAFAHSGGEEIIVSELSEADAQSLRERILADPGAYVAQEKIVRSTAPCWVEEEFCSGHIAMRTFAVRTKEAYEVLNGGLVRVETSAAPMPLSVSAGQFSKDVWVTSDSPVPAISLLGHMLEPPKLQRSTSKLPSRAADNLFWLGRYLERLEFAGRLIRKITERLMSESAGQPVMDVTPLISCLAEQGIIEESFAVEEFFPRRDELENLWPRMIRGDDDPNRFEGLCNQVVRLSSIVRDRMTEDFWRGVSQIGERRVPADLLDLSELHDTMNLLMLHISAATGQITDGLVHGPTRQFLQIGRHLERARQLTLVMRKYLQQVEARETLPLVTLLDVCNSLMTYRYRYRANFSILPAFDLLVTDSSNPHAIVFQFIELNALVSELPSKQKRPFISSEQDLIRRILFELQSLLPTEDQELNWPRYRAPLEQIFKTLEPRIKEISNLLTQTYFLHAEFIQQIDEGREGGA
ncbi:MAG: circularly permuted type 2 ATP-grasp protein [Planctomycetaceae bacterium]|nr:circularly permuted type 2 ATP-grasp protein [Planctomycetaceae bacterium]